MEQREGRLSPGREIGKNIGLSSRTSCRQDFSFSWCPGSSSESRAVALSALAGARWSGAHTVEMPVGTVCPEGVTGWAVLTLLQKSRQAPGASGEDRRESKAPMGIRESTPKMRL